MNITTPIAIDPLSNEIDATAFAADAELVRLYQQFIEERNAADALKRQWDGYYESFEAPPLPPVPEKLKSFNEQDRPYGMTVAECEAVYAVYKAEKGQEWADNWRSEVQAASAEHSAATKDHREAYWQAWEKWFPEGLRQRVDDAWDAVQATEQEIRDAHAKTSLGLLIKLRVSEAGMAVIDDEERSAYTDQWIGALKADAVSMMAAAQPIAAAE